MTKKNIAASIRTKLLNKARAEKQDFNLILTRYAIERFLYRISISSYADQFLLKGALFGSIYRVALLAMPIFLAWNQLVYLNWKRYLRNCARSNVVMEYFSIPTQSKPGKFARKLTTLAYVLLFWQRWIMRGAQSRLT